MHCLCPSPDLGFYSMVSLARAGYWLMVQHTTAGGKNPSIIPAGMVNHLQSQQLIKAFQGSQLFVAVNLVVNHKHFQALAVSSCFPSSCFFCFVLAAHLSRVNLLLWHGTLLHSCLAPLLPPAWGEQVTLSEGC